MAYLILKFIFFWTQFLCIKVEDEKWLVNTTIVKINKEIGGEMD